MEFLAGDAFDALFADFNDSAFHLEVQDEYCTPDEAEPFRLFLTGQHDDFAWMKPWLRLVRTATAVGKSITRARVVSVPHVDYTRWGLTVAEHNIAAGEDIRWVPRDLVEPTGLPADDFWLFDERRVVFTVFEPSGRFAGGAVTVDPTIVAYCLEARQRIWDKAIPHRQYRSSGSGSA